IVSLISTNDVFIVVIYLNIKYILLYIFFIFFFQAEDGIRDRNVTGVQTCALPILPAKAAAEQAEAKPEQATNSAEAKADDNVYRSEERRVGKECRSRRWKEHYKKNMNQLQILN